VIRYPEMSESAWREPDESADPIVPELLLNAGGTRATTFEEYDAEQAVLSTPAYIAKRSRAPVAGVAFLGSRVAVDRELVEFALIEGFLAQHLGGLMEPMPWKRLDAVGLRVIYGLDKLRFLVGHPELAPTRLNRTQRAELTRGVAAFGKAIRALPIKPCDELPARILHLAPPAVLLQYRYTDEVAVLLNKLTGELGDAAVAAGCTTGMITDAAEESIRRGR